MEVIHVQNLDDLPPDQRGIALQLLNEWDPENTNQINFWSGRRGYALSWHDGSDGHILKFRRNWSEGDDQACYLELVLLEAAVEKRQGKLKLLGTRSVLYTGHANGWTYLGPLKDLYHTPAEIDAWQRLRDRRDDERVDP